MFDNIRQDIKAQSGHTGFLGKMKIIIFSHSFHLLLIIRLGGYIKNVPFIGAGVRVIIEYLLIRILYSSDISCKAKILGGLNIMHGHDIVIGSGVKIGTNFKIFNGVTLGNKDTNNGKVEQPIIGNNVTIGTGVKVLGNIKIGDNTIVGANSVVTRDIPSNEVWAGVPAKKIKVRDELF